MPSQHDDSLFLLSRLWRVPLHIVQPNPPSGGSNPLRLAHSMCRVIPLQQFLPSAILLTTRLPLLVRLLLTLYFLFARKKSRVSNNVLSSAAVFFAS